MTNIQQYLEPQYLKDNCNNYQIIDPLLFARKLNKLLKTREVRREAHRCALAFDAVKRFQVLEDCGFDRYPKPSQPYDGEEFLFPEQPCTMDWQFDLGPGRPPNYHQFVMPSGCHWRCNLDLMLARKLMPDLEWIVASAPKHTMVVAPEEHLIFDMSYFALGVSAETALKQVFGDDFSHPDEVTFFLEEYAFSPFTIEVINFWDVLDNKECTQLQKELLLRDMYRDVIEPAQTKTQTVSSSFS